MVKYTLEYKLMLLQDWYCETLDLEDEDIEGLWDELMYENNEFRSYARGE